MTATMPPGAPEKPAGGFSNLDRFMARVKGHLASVPLAERGPWLQRQVAVWVRDYERWALAVDSGWDTPAGISAEEYLSTISALDRLRREQPPCP